LKDVNWQLFVVVNERDFFADIDRQWQVLVTIISLVFVLVFVLTVLILRPVIRRMLREKQLFEQSHRDGLTGLYNHAYMQMLLDREIERSQRYGRVFSLFMFDLDHFKNVNDMYGHQAGDEILKQVSEVVIQTMRQSDLVARYGGEEFLVILPETDSEGASVLAERLRRNISELMVSIVAEEISVTVSIGVLTCNDCGDHLDKHQIVEAADKAMYASKNGGRNQVTAVILNKRNEEPILVKQARY
jgi:diguanylate cyclase (GGDEF)-like protein